MTRDDGGPAFPAEIPKPGMEERFTNVRFPGMSLRDYFAGQVVMGVVAEYPNSPEMVVEMAYQIADLMIKARGEEDGAK